MVLAVDWIPAAPALAATRSARMSPLFCHGQPFREPHTVAMFIAISTSFRSLAQAGCRASVVASLRLEPCSDRSKSSVKFLTVLSDFRRGAATA
jgi:hypothetical protein